jgi:hypothetical protein
MQWCIFCPSINCSDNDCPVKLTGKKREDIFGAIIREALKKSLDSENGKPTDDDPLFLDNAVFDVTTPEDLASNHDGYLYGDET